MSPESPSLILTMALKFSSLKHALQHTNSLTFSCNYSRGPHTGFSNKTGQNRVCTQSHFLQQDIDILQRSP